MVTPCISLLRNIALQVNTSFGARLGTKHHVPDLGRDLTTLQDSMRANGVLRQDPGRILRGIKNGEQPNAITAGLLNLREPLSDYNQAFAKLQRRRRQTPLGPLDAPSQAAVGDSDQVEEACPTVPPHTSATAVCYL